MSGADEARLQAAVVLFGVSKAEVVRRLIRASVQAGPALSAENTRAVVELAQQVRMVGRNLSQVLRAIHRGQAVRIEDTEPVWRGLHEMVAAINTVRHQNGATALTYSPTLAHVAQNQAIAMVSHDQLSHDFGPGLDLRSRATASSPRPCTRGPPSRFSDCGVYPRCPTTGMPASVSARICGTTRRPPSSFTAATPVSFMIRTPVASACSGPDS